MYLIIKSLTLFFDIQLYLDKSALLRRACPSLLWRTYSRKRGIYNRRGPLFDRFRFSLWGANVSKGILVNELPARVGHIGFCAKRRKISPSPTRIRPGLY